jgi:predicted ATPase/DNA-binding winged helix-turn-helix (wHTH) protein
MAADSTMRLPWALSRPVRSMPMLATATYLAILSSRLPASEAATCHPVSQPREFLAMNGAEGGIASFGPFQLSSAKRALLRNDEPVPLGDRALDILIVLVERAGEVVTQRELISRVWRDLVVTPGNLRVHMSALRKALGDGEAGARYIENVTGQGYCFVASVTHSKSAKRTDVPPSSSSVALRMRALPPALARMVGRDDTVRTIAEDLRIDRFVTIVGPGGMGKTTVAISVAHAMLEEFAGNVCLVDLGAMNDPGLLAATVASTLGLPMTGSDAVATLMAFLRSTRVLLILDNCEHVIDAAASLAEAIYSRASKVHILATSREALRAEGEHAHWLRPLAAPPPDATLSAAQALAFPAVKLFVERAAASDSDFVLTDENAKLVAEICGRLDGIALAIEFVAGRVGIYGLSGTAELLNTRFGLRWQGRRTALPRHQTLQSLLGWSYDLLTSTEQCLLRGLAIFVGNFTLEAVKAVVLSDVSDVAASLENLIAKSLVSVGKTNLGVIRYRLLETTRIFAFEKLEELGEADTVARRHAQYFAQLMREGSAQNGGGSQSAFSYEHLGNLRSALDWSFRNGPAPPEEATRSLSIDLAAAAAPVFLEFSLWSECQRWCEAALARLDDSTRGDYRELVLQEARAISLMWAQGNSDEVRLAITRGLEVAHRLESTVHRLRLLTGLHTFLVRTNDFRGSLEVADQLACVAQETEDELCLAMSDWLRGSSNHFLGHQLIARQLYESGFQRGGVRAEQHFGLDFRVRALVGFSRTLWLNGLPERASQIAKQAIDEAVRSGKPINICFSLIYTCHVFLWCGDLVAAQNSVHQLISHPYWEVMPGFHSEGFAMKGELVLLGGDVEYGNEVLRRALQDMRSSRQTSLRAITECRLAETMIALGKPDDAHTLIDHAIAHAPGAGESVDAPELLRVKASILLSMPQADTTAAETCLLNAVALAQRQCAKGWELRTTITLAQLRAQQGRRSEARDLLEKIYDQFTEGFETHDLRMAADMLRQFETRTSSAASGDASFSA